MSLLKGKVIVTRSYVNKFKGVTDSELRGMIKPFIVVPLAQDSADTCRAGVCTIAGGTDLDSESLFCGEYSAFGYRVDTKKIDMGALRKAVKEACTDWLSTNVDYKRVPKDTKNAFYDQLRTKMLTSTFPVTKVYTVIVNTKSGMMYTDISKPVVFDGLLSSFQGYEITPVRDGLAIDSQRYLELNTEVQAVDPNEASNISLFLTKMANNSIENRLVAPTTKEKLFVNQKVVFDIADRTCTITGDCIEAMEAYQTALSSGGKIIKLTLQKEGDVEFFVSLDESQRLQMFVPNSEAEDTDSILIARMEHIEAVCEMVDKLVIEYVNFIQGVQPKEQPLPLVEKEKEKPQSLVEKEDIVMSFQMSGKEVSFGGKDFDKIGAMAKELKKTKKPNFKLDK